MVLTTVDVLSAGFDSPACSVIFQPYQTSSTTKYIQRMGRALRINPGTDKSECRIYVYGSLPRIRDLYYHRLQNLSLNQSGGFKTYETYLEELEYNDELPGHHQYEYNQTVCDAIKRMEKLDMPILANLLNKKEFPKRFTDKIKTLIERLPSQKTPIPHRNLKATPRQITYLLEYSFEKSQLEGLKRGEAYDMIRTIKGPPQGEFVLPSGKFKGLHVTETPFSYRKYVAETWPESEIASIIKKWNQSVSCEGEGLRVNLA